ncbi:zinc-dependent metalloprotease, partial [candidate division KSB1 bacterium]
TDQDARSQGTAHPLTHLWDNGKHPVEELKRVLEIRELALEKFSENNIRMGEPLATLEEVLVPVYPIHRYQIEAASKVLGGVYYYYNIRGDRQQLPEIVSPDEQREALHTLLNTIDTGVLALDERIINLIPPRPPGYGESPELFSGRTGAVFDPVAAAETAADLTVTMLLNPERAARLVDFHARDASYPGLGEVIDKLLQTTWYRTRGAGYHAEIQRAVDNIALSNLLRLAANTTAAPQARALTMLKINELKIWLTAQLDFQLGELQEAHYFYGLKQIEQFEKDPEKLMISSPLRAPNGSPIGMINEDLLGYYRK